MSLNLKKFFGVPDSLESSSETSSRNHFWEFQISTILWIVWIICILLASFHASQFLCWRTRQTGDTYTWSSCHSWHCRAQWSSLNHVLSMDEWQITQALLISPWNLIIFASLLQIFFSSIIPFLWHERTITATQHSMWGKPRFCVTSFCFALYSFLCESFLLVFTDVEQMYSRNYLSQRQGLLPQWLEWVQSLSLFMWSYNCLFTPHIHYFTFIYVYFYLPFS